MKNRSFVEWMYSTKSGRAFLKIMLYSGILKAAEKIARARGQNRRCVEQVRAGGNRAVRGLFQKLN